MASPDQVHDNPDESRFELEVEGETSFTVYQKEGNVITFVHTEVPGDERGEGLGNTLIEGALQQVRAEGLKVVPLCPFVDAYIRRHPDEQDLLAEQT